MTLRQRLQALLLAFFVLLAANAALAVTTTRSRDVVLEETARLERAREAAQNVLGAVVDQQTGLRGYVITSDEALLQPYHSGRDHAQRELEVLRELLGDNPALLRDVERIADAAERWHREAAEPEIAAVQRGDPRTAVTLVAGGRSRAVFDELRGALGQLRGDLTARNAELSEQLTRARQRFNNLLIVTSVAGLLLLAGTGLLLRWWVTLPLERLSRDVRRVANGHLHEAIRPTGPVELARIGYEAEQMRQRIVEELERALRAREALEQHGPLVVTLRDHLRPSYSPLPQRLQSAGRFVPAEGVLAGDWYDLVAFGDGRVALLLVDVSGHGPEAGVFALLAKQLLLVGLREGRDPGETLGWVAEQLGDTGEIFLSGVLVEVDLESGSGRYANAGHLPVLLARDTTVEELPPTGPILGPIPGQWRNLPISLEPGDLLIAYTDGVVEARNDEAAEFGMERLLQLVTDRAAHGPEVFVEACEEAVRAFTGGEVRDDLTVVALALARAYADEGVLPGVGG